MVSVAIILNTSKKLSDNEYPIVLRVTHQYKRKYYSINSLLTDQSRKFRCNPTNWRPPQAEDNGLGRFTKGFNSYKECNVILETKLREANAILKNYDADGIAFDFDRFGADLKKKERQIITSLQEYYTAQIAVLDGQGRVGLSGLCFEVQRILKKFRPDAVLSDVNFRFLESFEYWMRNERGNKDTTISVKMRNLQGNQSSYRG